MRHRRLKSSFCMCKKETITDKKVTQAQGLVDLNYATTRQPDLMKQYVMIVN